MYILITNQWIIQYYCKATILSSYWATSNYQNCCCRRNISVQKSKFELSMLIFHNIEVILCIEWFIKGHSSNFIGSCRCKCHSKAMIWFTGAFWLRLNIINSYISIIIYCAQPEHQTKNCLYLLGGNLTSWHGRQIHIWEKFHLTFYVQICHIFML